MKHNVPKRQLKTVVLQHRANDSLDLAACHTDELTTRAGDGYPALWPASSDNFTPTSRGVSERGPESLAKADAGLTNAADTFADNRLLSDSSARDIRAPRRLQSQEVHFFSGLPNLESLASLDQRLDHLITYRLP